MSERWLIWSIEHGAWWGEGRNGYTKLRSEAGRYTLEEAAKIAKHANAYRADDDPPQEAMVRMNNMSKEIWPAPRDARTDPPKVEDADQCDNVLAWDGLIWIRAHYKTVRNGSWLPLPPKPPPPKSDAESAWETLCGPDNENPWLRDDAHAKALFIAGYNAKGAK